MRLLVILPISVPDYNAAVHAQVARHVGPHSVDVECLRVGPAFVGSVDDEIVAGEHVRARIAQLAGYDGVFVDCFGDPGVDHGAVAIPHVGAFVPAMIAAQELGQPISIILPNRELADHIQRRAASHGWTAITYGLEAPTREHIFACARAIAAAPERQTIILGCTAWASFADELRAEVAADVIEPEETAVRFLVRAVAQGQAES